MILKSILQIITFALSGILNVVGDILPGANLEQVGQTALSIVLEFSTQALNFCYFMVGDTLFLLLPLALGLLFTKIVVLPIVIILRSIFIKGNI